MSCIECATDLQSCIDEHLIRGCETQVWCTHQQDEQGFNWFLASGESRIIRGLLLVIFSVANGQSSAFIASFDWQRWFEKLALIQHLSPSRNNGLTAITERILELSHP